MAIFLNKYDLLLKAVIKSCFFEKKRTCLVNELNKNIFGTQWSIEVVVQGWKRKAWLNNSFQAQIKQYAWNCDWRKDGWINWANVLLIEDTNSSGVTLGVLGVKNLSVSYQRTVKISSLVKVKDASFLLLNSENPNTENETLAKHNMGVPTFKK